MDIDNNPNLEKIWNRVPVDYYEKGVKYNLFQRLWHSEKIATLKKLIDKKGVDNILDVGCNSGWMANEVAKIFPKAKVYGIDVYKKAILFGKNKYPHLHLSVADAHNLPFKTNFFDLIICYETVEHVAKPSIILEEIARALKKNGLAIIAMDSGNILFRTIWFFWENTKGKVWKGAHLHPFKDFELERIIKKSRLKIIKKLFSHFSMEVSFICQKEI